MSYGCCPDGQTPAAGYNDEGCPESYGCGRTAYGCCPDGVTSANGFNNEGCEEPVKTCHDSPHGCCPDGISEAAGIISFLYSLQFLIFCTMECFTKFAELACIPGCFGSWSIIRFLYHMCCIRSD